MSLTLVILAGVTVAVGFLVAAFIALEHRSVPGVSPFIVLCLLLAAAPLPMVHIWMSGSETTIMALFVIFTFVWLAWLVLALEYTGSGPTMTAPRIGVLVAYGVLTALGVLVHPLVPDEFMPVLFQLNTVLQSVLFALLAYGVFLVTRSGARKGVGRRGEALVLAVAGFVLLFSALLRVLTPEFPVQPMQVPQLGLLGCIAALFILAQVRYDVFESGPGAGHLARETVFDNMDEAVFITDRGNRILDCNRTATELFRPTREQLLGTSVAEILGHKTDWSRRKPVELNTMNGYRTFDISRSPLRGEHETPVGWAYLLRDVTEQQTHEQRVDVLNRVLRHNLRNDLDAISGFAETLEHDWDGESVDEIQLTSRIQTTARALASLGETAEKSEKLLSRDQLEPRPVDVVTLVDSLFEEYRTRYPGVTLAADTVGGSEIRTDETILKAVFEEVLENALEHNDSESPTVTVNVTRPADAHVRIEIRDDGPGIPAQERDVLLEGEESPLRHGSGLGLWLVHWSVLRLGGELRLEENDPRGTVVSLVIPDMGTADTLTVQSE